MRLGATPEGTRAYARERARMGIHPEHFRVAQTLTLSSIGLGTYLGGHDDETDALYEAAIVLAVERGVNVLDTAVNYRCQRSERTIARALGTLKQKGFTRNQLVIATKGGFIPFDGAPPADMSGYLERTFVKRGILRKEDIVAGCHSLAPRYIENQIETSLENLGLSTLDVYYIHNPETELKEISRAELFTRLRAAFEVCERAVVSGKVAFYGTATWDAYRTAAALSLREVVDAAQDVGGEEHHFRFVQLPYSLGMPEAFTERNQSLVGGKKVSPIEAAHELGLTVMSSVSIQQGRLTHALPAWLGSVFKGLHSDAQRAIQFARSTPWLTSALVGMKQPAHVRENTDLARVPPAPLEDFLQLFESQV